MVILNLGKEKQSEILKSVPNYSEKCPTNLTKNT